MMKSSRFLEALEHRVILGDGAYGTEFLRRGGLLSRPFDEMNLTRPQAVLDLHREYVSAGAELIKTNTFRANRVALRKANLEGQVREINQAGARLAREAAGQWVFVAGSVGPLAEVPVDQKNAAFEEQCAALAEGGCDLLFLETFTDPIEAALAVKAARGTDLPVAGLVARSGPFLCGGGTLLNVDVAGVNCMSGDESLRAVAELAARSPKFLSAFPSAGLPGAEVGPGEFADWIQRLVGASVRLVGGCCGAGPDHIRAAAAVLGRGG